MASDTKGKHLSRVFKAMVASVFLVVWMQKVLLSPLKAEGIDMAHMDPSEIISIPYDLDRLNVFVMFPVTIILLLTLIRVPEKMLSFSVALGRLTLVVYALLGLCGANIVENFKHSILAALYIASLVSTTFTTDDVTSQILAQLPLRDHSDILKTSRIFGTIVGCIPFQILSVLDRGAQIQRWPIPVILGVTYGYVFGSIVGLFMLSSERRLERRRQ